MRSWYSAGGFPAVQIGCILQFTIAIATHQVALQQSFRKQMHTWVVVEARNLRCILQFTIAIAIHQVANNHFARKCTHTVGGC